MYNYIPLGDHCIIAMILKELNLRKCSYPFDWTSNNNELFESNLRINIGIFNELMNNCPPRDCAINYIGNASTAQTKFHNNVFFPHDFENGTYEETLEKYTRRFERLYEHTKTQPSTFIIVVRCYNIYKNDILKLWNTLDKYNHNLILITGTHQSDLEQLAEIPNITYKYIPYDHNKYYSFDYSDFRPAVKNYLMSLLCY